MQEFSIYNGTIKSLYLAIINNAHSFICIFQWLYYTYLQWNLLASLKQIKKVLNLVFGPQINQDA